MNASTLDEKGLKSEKRFQPLVIALNVSSTSVIIFCQLQVRHIVIIIYRHVFPPFLCMSQYFLPLFIESCSS